MIKNTKKKLVRSSPQPVEKVVAAIRRAFPHARGVRVEVLDKYGCRATFAAELLPSIDFA